MLNSLLFGLGLATVGFLKLILRFADPRIVRHIGVRAAESEIGRLDGRFYRFLHEAVDTVRNHGYEIDRNGEAWLIAACRDVVPFRAFDVGANRGGWSERLLANHPNADLHVFEIIPSLAERLKGLPAFVGKSVTVNPVGLGKTEGDVIVHVPVSGDQRTSLLQLSSFSQEVVTEVPARITTGNNYCRAHGIDRIDLLKIDAEGLEFAILEGFDEVIKNSPVAIVQFEYNICAATSRKLLIDHYHFFEERGYDVGKLFPRGVWFGSFNPEWEDLRGGNFVAVRRDRPELRRRLAWEPPTAT